MTNLEWPIWRVVMSRYATLRELSEVYTLDDLADFHEAIDIELEMNDHARAKEGDQ